MMKLTESYRKIFDRVTTIACAEEAPNLWMVSECKPSSRLKQLRVHFTADSYVFFDDTVCKNMPDITKFRTSHIKDDECDGIGIFQSGVGTTMVFVDLKSNFNTTKIQHGFSQGLTSFVKLHTMLSLCDGYNLSETSLEFVVACCCFPDEDKETKTLDWMLRQRTSEPDSFVSRVAYPLYEKGCIQVRIGDFPQLSSLPLNMEIYNKSVKLSLVRSACYTDNYADYSLR